MTKIKCRLCGDIIGGDYKGTFKECKCKSCYIDETKYYCRIGGNPGDVYILRDGCKKFKKLDFKPEKVDKELTKEQEDVLNIIKDFIKSNGYSPTDRELCDITGKKSLGTISYYKKILKKKGYIDYVFNRKRTIVVKENKE